jgi:selenocysteine lyase/cysteine desulfurase
MSRPGSPVSRRDFARYLAVGTAAMVPSPLSAIAADGPPPALPPTPVAPDEAFWLSVRQQFLMPADLGVMNAANLCPSPAPVLDAVTRATRDMDSDRSFENRRKMSTGKEAARQRLAAFLRVTPEQVLLTRNTSEGNNMVSSGVDLRAGDEVLIFADNHPSNHAAWTRKAARDGFTVITLPQPNPHPGAEYYLDAVRKAITPRTRVLAFTHHTSSVGDVLPARELCRLAREHDVLTLVDGACTFGMVDLDLSDMQPDFYTGSAHKWPCGPKEVGVLYVNAKAQSRLHATIVSAYAGAVGLSRSHESFGQRDEPAIMGFAEALAFQERIGRRAIEERSRALAQALIAGLRAIDGVTLWTHPDPTRSGAVVSFRPGTLDVPRLTRALYERDRIGCAPRGGTDRPGIRFSPHFYNTMAEVDRAVAAIARYMKQGV